MTYLLARALDASLLLSQLRLSGLADCRRGPVGTRSSGARVVARKEAMRQHEIHMPTEVDSRMGFFDRFAGHASKIASRAPFFVACVLLILVWAPTLAFLKFDTWQLLINTATTIVTFLLVALLQNSQTRNDQATQHKLNAIADGLDDLIDRIADDRE